VYVLIPGWRAQAQQRQLKEILVPDEPQDCGAIDCPLGMNISDDSEKALTADICMTFMITGDDYEAPHRQMHEPGTEAQSGNEKADQEEEEEKLAEGLLANPVRESEHGLKEVST
jgi:hypothetical protein